MRVDRKIDEVGPGLVLESGEERLEQEQLYQKLGQIEAARLIDGYDGHFAHKYAVGEPKKSLMYCARLLGLVEEKVYRRLSRGGGRSP